MIVAYYFPHNDGLVKGIITEAGFDSGTNLVDLYEVDGCLASFTTKKEAETWLLEQGPQNYDSEEDS